jgi:hypothetical protein
MKSNYLMLMLPLPRKDFEEFLQELRSSNEHDLSLIIKYLPKIYSSTTNFEEKSVTSELLGNLSNKRLNLSIILEFCSSLIRDFIFITDRNLPGTESEIDYIISDFQDLGLLKNNEISLIKDFISAIAKISVDDIIPNRKKFSVSTQSLPSIKSMNSNLDFRVVFKKEFDRLTSISDYEPGFKGLVPIAIITIEFDEYPNRVNFQLSKSILDDLINLLNATKIKMQVAEKEIKS